MVVFRSAALTLLLLAANTSSTWAFSPAASKSSPGWAAATRRSSTELYDAPPEQPSFVNGIASDTTSSSTSKATTSTTSTSSSLPATQESEKILRKEIAERNSAVENEQLYSVTQWDCMKGAMQQEQDAGDSGEAVSSSTPSSDKQSLQSKMERMMKPRAYPLFLAEKAAEVVENQLSDLTKALSSVGVDLGTGDYAAPMNGSSTSRERLVVLGTGWGAAAFLKDIDTSMYDVTVISPRNYFLFTPMLAGASVGTVEYRSITEPVREINRKAEYLEATATNIDSKTNTVSCQSVVCEGNSCDINEFEVQYDKLIVTVGAQTNTFGIPGVREHCCFLKQVEDARRIRTAIVNCFERANLPQLTDEEREDNLTFAVIGAGPTGIEFAAELRDFVEEDGPKYYPNLLKHVRIKVIEATSSILAPFDKSLQEEAIQQLKRKVRVSDPDVADLLPERFELTELLLDSSVKEVKENSIELNNGKVINYGLAVWAAGNGPLPITLQLIEDLGGEQAKLQDVARGRLAVDPWLRVVGGGGDILAFGDCSCITGTAQLPATAQVAAQEGEYLGKLLTNKYCFNPSPVSEDGNNILPPPTKDPDHQLTVSEGVAGFATQNPEYAKPFQFLNLGILAYTGGGSALAQVATAPNAPNVKGKGVLGNAIWRSVYLSKQVSWRNRLLVINDWIKRRVFGRDITRV